MTCVRGDCPRPGETWIEKQWRCRQHAAELAAALAQGREQEQTAASAEQPEPKRKPGLFQRRKKEGTHGN